MHPGEDFTPFTLLRSRPPQWPIWHAPALGRPILLGAVFDSEAGFTAVDLTYYTSEVSEQAIIESRGAALSARKLEWSLWRLDSADDVSEVFSPVARDFEMTGIKAEETVATVGGLRVVGTTLQVGRSAASTFLLPSHGSALVFMRRGRLREESLPNFEELSDLADAEAERKKIQRRLTNGG